MFGKFLALIVQASSDGIMKEENRNIPDDSVGGVSKKGTRWYRQDANCWFWVTTA